MILADALSDEAQRLQVLRQYDLLDTSPEHNLDELVELVAQICETPISLISLVDDHRHWFKSRVGLEIEELLRNISFCEHALAQSELFLVPDTLADSRFFDNPLVTGAPGVRFYGGAPLITREGIRIGILCVIDHVPRHLTEAQKQAVRILGRQVMTQFELRRRQIELRASEARYRTLFEYAPDGIIISSAGGAYIDANESMCGLLGYTRDELMGRVAADILAPSEISNIAAARAAISAGQPYPKEWRFRRKDGSLFDAEVIATVMPDGNRLAVVRDITERKRTEARFRRLVNSNAQGVFFGTSGGGITDANDAFLKLVGYSREDLENGGIGWAALTPPEYVDADRLALEQLRITGTCTPYEKEFYRKDGTRVPILIGSATFEDCPEEGVCFIVDLTERKKLEQQFLRAQRMESIGTLAGGVAHDLNNALGPIIMALDLLRMRFPDIASQELIDIIGSSARRGADMVRQVLSFARGMEGRREEVNIRHLLQDLEKMAVDTFLRHIEVGIVVPENLWTVTGDATQLHQVLVNLSVNARDSMPDGGLLTLSAANVILDKHGAGLGLNAKPGPYVFLQIQDQGAGMSEELMGKIFDPFFTTKDLGKGTGLGLSTSLAIVKSHGGLIRVSSEIGKGSIFKVYLPATTHRAEVNLIAGETELPRGHGEMILVVDDEASVRQITQQTLEAFGYCVLLAGDGEKALAVHARHRSEIRAVLTDMMMPVMDGASTIEALRRRDGRLPIIAASGLTSSTHVAHAASLGVTHFLPKPYTAEALLTVLRNLLAKNST